MSNVSSSSSSGIGFCGALTIVFIVLKLMHIIDWDWWLVLCPIWLPLMLLLVVISVLIITALITATKQD